MIRFPPVFLDLSFLTHVLQLYLWWDFHHNLFCLHFATYTFIISLPLSPLCKLKSVGKNSITAKRDWKTQFSLITGDFSLIVTQHVSCTENLPELPLITLLLNLSSFNFCAVSVFHSLSLPIPGIYNHDSSGFCSYQLKLMFQAMENKILLSVILGWAIDDTVLMSELMSKTLFLIELTISWRTLLTNVFRMGRFTLTWKLPLKSTPINRTHSGFLSCMF